MSAAAQASPSVAWRVQTANRLSTGTVPIPFTVPDAKFGSSLSVSAGCSSTDSIVLGAGSPADASTTGSVSLLQVQQSGLAAEILHIDASVPLVSALAAGDAFGSAIAFSDHAAFKAGRAATNVSIPCLHHMLVGAPGTSTETGAVWLLEVLGSTLLRAVQLSDGSGPLVVSGTAEFGASAAFLPATDDVQAAAVGAPGTAGDTGAVHLVHFNLTSLSVESVVSFDLGASAGDRFGQAVHAVDPYLLSPTAAGGSLAVADSSGEFVFCHLDVGATSCTLDAGIEAITASSLLVLPDWFHPAEVSPSQPGRSALNARVFAAHTDGSISTFALVAGFNASSPQVQRLDVPSLQAAGAAFGAALALAELGNDAQPTLLVGAPGDTLHGTGAGAVWALSSNLPRAPAACPAALAASGVGLCALPPATGIDMAQGGIAVLDSATTPLSIHSFGANLGLGAAVAPLGDLDGNGMGDFVVGGSGFFSATANQGMVLVALVQAPGTVERVVQLSPGLNGVPGGWAAGGFGSAVAPAGDLNGDGYMDLFVGAPLLGAAGTVVALFMLPDGTALAGSTLLAPPVAFGDLSGLAETGSHLASLGDLDGDGVTELAVSISQGTVAGGAAQGVVMIAFVHTPTAPSVARTVVISQDTPGLDVDFGASNVQLAGALAATGDIDGNGAPDLAMAVSADASAGYVVVAFLRRSGILHRATRIEPSGGDFFGVSVAPTASFGVSLAFVGAPVEAGAPSLLIAVHSPSQHGAAVLVALRPNGAVQYAEWQDAPLTSTEADAAFSSVASLGTAPGGSSQIVITGAPGFSDVAAQEGAFVLVTGNLPSGSFGAEDGACAPAVRLLPGSCSGLYAFHGAQSAQVTSPSDSVLVTESLLGNNALFGSSMAPIGDINGDGWPDVVAGSTGVTLEPAAGAVTILFMNADGSAPHAVRSIFDSMTEFPPELKFVTVGDVKFGASVAGVGDMNDDGVPDIAVGAPSALTRGVVVIFFLQASGIPSTNVLLASGEAYAGSAIDGNTAAFGASMAAVGDIDGNGVVDLLIGAPDTTPPGGVAIGGRVTTVFLHTRGGVQSSQHISETEGNLLASFSPNTGWGAAIAYLGTSGFDRDTASIDSGFVAVSTKAGAFISVFELQADGAVLTASETYIAVGTGALSGISAAASFGGALTLLPDLTGDGTPELLATLPSDGSSKPELFIVYLDSSRSATHNLRLPTGNFGLPDRPGGSAFGNALVAGSVFAAGQAGGLPFLQLLIGDPTYDAAFVDGTCCDNSAGGVWSLRVPLPSGAATRQCPPALAGLPGGCTGAQATVQAFAATSTTTFASPSDLFRLEHLGDLDRDGVPDVASITDQGSGGSEGIAIIFLKAGGVDIKHFIKLETDQYGVPTLPTLALAEGLANGDISAVGDVNGDGNTDLLVGLSGTVRKAVLFMLQTDGSLVPGPIPEHGPLPTSSVLRVAWHPAAAGSTGHLRALVARFTATVNFVELISLSETSLSEIVADTSLGLSGDRRAARISSLGDVDGNGTPDFVVSDAPSAQLFLYLVLAENSGMFTMDPPSELSNAAPASGLPALNTYSLALGLGLAGPVDVDGDGTPDIVTAGRQSTPFRGILVNRVAVIALLLRPDGRVREVLDMGPLSSGVAFSTSFGADNFKSGVALVQPGVFPGSDRPAILHLTQNGNAFGCHSLRPGLLPMPAPGTSADDRLRVLSVHSVSYSGEGGDGSFAPPAGSGPQQLGGAITPYADVDGDGYMEVLIADVGFDGSKGNVHVVRITQEPFTATRLGSMLDHAPLAAAVGAGTQFGTAMAVIGYVNSDEYLDIAVTAPENPSTDRGVMYILLMGAGGSITDSSNTITGASVGVAGKFSHSVAALGDIDFDGIPDLITYTHDGYVYTLFLTAAGTLKHSKELAYGDPDGFSGGGMGTAVTTDVSVVSLGDMNNDGIIEVAFGKGESHIGSPGAIAIASLLSTGSLQDPVFITDQHISHVLQSSSLSVIASSMTFLGRMKSAAASPPPQTGTCCSP